MVEAIQTTVSLVIVYKSGLDKEGKDVFAKNIYDIDNPDVSDEELYRLGKTIAKLLDTQIYDISKEVKYSLIDL